MKVDGVLGATREAAERGVPGALGKDHEVAGLCLDDLAGQVCAGNSKGLLRRILVLVLQRLPILPEFRVVGAGDEAYSAAGGWLEIEGDLDVRHWVGFGAPAVPLGIAPRAGCPRWRSGRNRGPADPRPAGRCGRPP